MLYLAIALPHQAAASPFLAAALLRQPMRSRCNNMLRFAMPLRYYAEPLLCLA